MGESIVLPRNVESAHTNSSSLDFFPLKFTSIISDI
jgi:hypothetical protein